MYPGFPYAVEIQEANQITNTCLSILSLVDRALANAENGWQGSFRSRIEI
jgi:hypothetical protein